MKPQEILLASALIAVVSGAGAALATGAFQRSTPRDESAPRAASAQPGPLSGTFTADAQRAIEDLRLENASLQERLGALEARLSEVQSARTALAASAHDSAGLAAERVARDDARVGSALLEVTPEFVASVGQALDTIEAREEAEREAKRKELQALRIEERVTKLQAELGLNNRQTSDLRTALLTQDDKREALFRSMRDGLGEPRDMRESFRVLRDETHATLQGFLTPDQFTAYQASEESDFGRRDFGPGGPGRGPEGPGPGGPGRGPDGTRSGR